MNRREILKAIGLAPLLPVASVVKKLTASSPKGLGGMSFEQASEVAKATLKDWKYMPKIEWTHMYYKNGRMFVRTTTPAKKGQMVFWNEDGTVSC